MSKHLYLTLGVAALVVWLLGCGDDQSAEPVTSTIAPGSSSAAAPAVTSEAQGNIDEEEAPAQPPASAPPVSLNETAEFGNGVTAQLASIESIDATSRLPGEFGGPAVVMTVELANGSSAPVDLSGVAVDLRNAQDVPLYQLTTEPADHFSGELEPGASATARYVFTVAADERADARLLISYTADQPTVTLTGDLPNA